MIGPFRGNYRFLSNFWPAEVVYGEMVFPTVEHAYQAAKTFNLEHREQIRQAVTPGEAKRLGKLVSIRSSWEYDKLAVMRSLVGQKFRKHPSLRRMLLETGNEELIEINTWGDRFWGVSKGEGENHLGKILMRVRQDLREKIKRGG